MGCRMAEPRGTDEKYTTVRGIASSAPKAAPTAASGEAAKNHSGGRGRPQGHQRLSELAPEHAEVTQRPANTVDLGLEDAQKVMRMVDMLEDLDDVQEVYSNADFSDEVMAQLQ